MRSSILSSQSIFDRMATTASGSLIQKQDEKKIGTNWRFYLGDGRSSSSSWFEGWVGLGWVAWKNSLKVRGELARGNWSRLWNNRSLKIFSPETQIRRKQTKQIFSYSSRNTKIVKITFMIEIIFTFSLQQNGFRLTALLITLMCPFELYSLKKLSKTPPYGKILN